jgi:hypothetical protein
MFDAIDVEHDIQNSLNVAGLSASDISLPLQDGNNTP